MCQARTCEASLDERICDEAQTLRVDCHVTTFCYFVIVAEKICIVGCRNIGIMLNEITILFALKCFH